MTKIIPGDQVKWITRKIFLVWYVDLSGICGYFKLHHRLQVFLNFNVLTDGKLTQEDIEINYEENYVRVATPALDVYPPTHMILTQIRT